MLDSSIVSKTSDLTGFSMDSMFGSLVLDLLMLATLLIHSLSFVGFGFECATIGFYVSWFLAIIAGSVVSRLAPAR